MSARKISTKATGTAAKEVQFNPWLAAADFGKQQMAVATESTGAMFRGLDAMRKVQQQASERTVTRHSAVLAKIKAASEPAQLLALQSQLLAVDTENASLYWQELVAAAMEMQAEMLGCCSHLLDSAALLQATAAINHLPLPMADLNSLLVGGARESSSRR